MSPPKKSAIQKKTEYQAQFKTYEPPAADPMAPKASKEGPSVRARSRVQVSSLHSACFIFLGGGGGRVHDSGDGGMGVEVGG